MSSAKATKPRRRRDLSVDKIIVVAAELLRDEGEEALTMRRLAAACDVTPMAIYHHVGNKTDLLDAVMNHVILTALEPMEGGGASWREELTAIVLTFRNAFIDNPGAGRVFVRQAVVGPGTAIVTGHMFRLLRKGGLSGEAVAETADAITLVILGSVVNELTRPPQVRDQLLAHSDEPDKSLMQEHMKAYSHRDPEERFLKALNWLLDGATHGRQGADPRGGGEP